MGGAKKLLDAPKWVPQKSPRLPCERGSPSNLGQICFVSAADVINLQKLVRPNSAFLFLPSMSQLHNCTEHFRQRINEVRILISMTQLQEHICFMFRKFGRHISLTWRGIRGFRVSSRTELWFSSTRDLPLTAPNQHVQLVHYLMK